MTGQSVTWGQPAPQGSKIYIRVAHYNVSGNCPPPPTT